MQLFVHNYYIFVFFLKNLEKLHLSIEEKVSTLSILTKIKASLRKKMRQGYKSNVPTKLGGREGGR